VIFCLDNDGTKTFTDNIIHNAANRLIDAGKDVYIAIPKQINNIKTDFNDVARLQGISAINSEISNAITYKEWRNNAEKSIENYVIKHNISELTKSKNAINHKELEALERFEQARNIEQKNHVYDLSNTVSKTNSEQNNTQKIDTAKHNAHIELAKNEKEIY
jgi:hypothetical protein